MRLVRGMPRWFVLLLAVLVSALVQAQDVPPKFKVELKQPVAAPGQLIEAVATVTFAEGLHAYQNPQTDQTIIPIELHGDGFGLSDIAYPRGKEDIVGGLPDKYFVYSGTISIPFKFSAPAKVGPDGIKFIFSYQQCNETNCFAPGEVHAAAPLTIEGKAVQRNTAGQTTTPTTKAPPAPAATGLGKFLQDSFVSKNWGLLALALLVIGLAINLTPCVYPLIPVTISFFAGQATSGEKSNKAGLAFNYMLGIAMSYGVVGGIAALSGGVFGQLFQNPWFNAALGAFMVVLALSMFDLYQIGIPPGISKHLKGRSGPVGSLIMGSLVGIGAAPCAGPIIVLLLTELAKLNNPSLSILSFVLVGFGMGIPYFILGMLSNSSTALPKAGGWMKIIKAFMGLAVIYFGLGYFIQAVPQLGDPNVEPWIYLTFFLMGALVLYLFDRKSTDARTWKVKGFGMLALGVFVGVTYANILAQSKLQATKEEFKKLLAENRGTVSEFQAFSNQSWEAAKASGKPIFIDVGANWCVKCKVIEHEVFDDPKFITVTKGFVLLRIDHSTGVDPAYIEATTKQFGIRGLPHMVIAKPGGEIAMTFNELHSVSDLDGLFKKAGVK